MNKELVEKLFTDINIFFKEMKNVNVIPEKERKLYEILSCIQKNNNLDTYLIESFKKIYSKITLWQHPKFFAFFPSTVSNPCMLGNFYDFLFGNYNLNDYKTNELELEVMENFRVFFDLPEEYSFKNGGVSYASSTCGMSSLYSIFLARQQKSNIPKNKLVIYITDMSHNHIEKSVVLNDIVNIRSIKSIYDKDNKIIKSDFEDLEIQIKKDIKNGLTPFYIFGVFGSTNLGFISDLEKFSIIKKKYDMFFFLDCAYGGSFFCLDNLKKFKNKLNEVDLISINLSKSFGYGMSTNLTFFKNRKYHFKPLNIDCESNNLSLYKINPSYHNGIIKYSFLFKCYELEEIRDFYRLQYKMYNMIHEEIKKYPIFKIVYKSKLPLVVFRLFDKDLSNMKLNSLNQELINKINDIGEFYFVGSESFGIFYLRISIGNIIDFDFYVYKEFLEKINNIGIELLKNN